MSCEKPDHGQLDFRESIPREFLLSDVSLLPYRDWRQGRALIVTISREGTWGMTNLLSWRGFSVAVFPMYRAGDTNAKPTGGTRQLQYRLVPGEAGWMLKVDQIVEY